MSHRMGKPTICIGENKGAVTAKLISAFVFATRIVQFLYFLNPKFPVSPADLWGILSGPGNRVQTFFLD